jgi:carbonic anhydrase
VVACMDARLDPRGLLGLRDGDAHVIRNAGGVVTADVIRSLTISQLLLGTREIILIHHTRCGMLTLTDDEFVARLRAETGLTHHAQGLDPRLRFRRRRRHAGRDSTARDRAAEASHRKKKCLKHFCNS